jgi:choline kinase
MLLLDADILFDPKILTKLRDSPYANALVVRLSNNLGREEIKLKIDRSGRVTKIGKEITPLKAVGESLGIEKFSAAAIRPLFEALEERKDRDEFYEASFQEIIDGGVKIYSVDSESYPCIEIDTIEDLRAADKLARAAL